MLSSFGFQNSTIVYVDHILHVPNPLVRDAHGIAIATAKFLALF
jgi:hypothetical protein